MRTLCHLPLLLALLAFPSGAFAHRLDEYLQATLVNIEPGSVRLHIILTPGVAVADQVVALIDRDRDRAISTNEAAAYCELLKRDLTLRLDGRRLELKLNASEFPAPSELRSGEGMIRMDFSATPGPLAVGAHRLTLTNRHLTTLSVYLVNAAKPVSGSIRITEQKRNKTQSAEEIEFRLSSAAGAIMGYRCNPGIAALGPARTMACCRPPGRGGPAPVFSLCCLPNSGIWPTYIWPKQDAIYKAKPWNLRLWQLEMTAPIESAGALRETAPAPGASWGATKRVGFRFVFSFFALCLFTRVVIAQAEMEVDFNPGSRMINSVVRIGRFVRDSARARLCNESRSLRSAK